MTEEFIYEREGDLIDYFRNNMTDPSNRGSSTSDSFTATAGQTEFGTAIGFIDGYEQVYFNGLLLLRGTDYTTAGGNTVTLSSGAAVDDIIEVIGISNLNSANTYTQEEIDSAILVAVPDQTGHGNKFLTTDGTSTSWGTVDTGSLEIANIMGAY